MEQNRFVIITGMSGAGKTQVLRTLEDLNYFCVDNLPVMLLPKFTELSRQTPGRNTAMVIDTRGGDAFSSLVEIMDEMHANGFDFEVLFLDADDATLIRRYKETRRRHPMEKGRYSLAESVSLERNLMADVKSRATKIIDTSRYSNSLLKEEIGRLFGDENSAQGMLIVVQSFGFKYGLPLDSDLVLDARFLPNPFYEADLKKLTGNDQPVQDFLNKFPQTYEFIKMECEMLNYLIPKYEKEGKSQLVISIGCTGGQHRSVYIADNIYNYLRLKYPQVELRHRELNRKS
ncbi:MAG: RNase adapter RapZ [Acidaminococcaceae bacterium]|nr:RNase adapter RapZ [Acidaminococcaceae bacterium]MBQ6913170.1 RNase adapter RapZ [Acidaminococcaceae bacterium]